MPGAPNRTKKPVHISKKPYTFHESANPKITKRGTRQQATLHGIPHAPCDKIAAQSVTPPLPKPQKGIVSLREFRVERKRLNMKIPLNKTNFLHRCVAPPGT